MVVVYREIVNKNFNGTVIDIETIGNFCEQYDDSRHYKLIIPVIFGYIDGDKLEINCAESQKEIITLRIMVLQILPKLRRPLYGFNCIFERGVLFHFCNIPLNFDGELNIERYEPKRVVVSSLELSDYEDPFNDNGYYCSLAWINGKIEQVIKHNRSCLLKERDILLKRGCRQPDDLKLFGE